jgi:hypothetical protein
MFLRSVVWRAYSEYTVAEMTPHKFRPSSVLSIITMVTTRATGNDMLSEQARKRQPYSAVAAAENSNDEDGDMCSGQKHKRTKENDTAQGERWTCTECDTSNDGMESQCTNCSARLPKQTGTVLDFGDLTAKLTNDKWKCETCNSMNDNGLNKCAACEEPRAGGVGVGVGGTTAAAATTTTAGSIVISGISFVRTAPALSSFTTTGGGAASEEGSTFNAPAAAATGTSSAPATMVTGFGGENPIIEMIEEITNSGVLGVQNEE